MPQVSAVWSADPDQLWSFPASFLAEFFSNHGSLQLLGRPRWRTVTGGSRRYVEALTRSVRRRDPDLGARCASVTRDAGHGVEVTWARGRRALRRGRARLPLRSGAGDAGRTRPPPRREVLGAMRLPAKRRRAAHRRADDAPAPAGMGELELPPRGRADGPHDRDLPHESPAVARRRPGVPGHAQPQRARSIPRKVLGSYDYAHPVITRDSVAAQERWDEVSRPGPHPLLRRLLALGLSRGRRLERAARVPRRRRRSPRRPRARGAGARRMTRSALYRGWVSHSPPGAGRALLPLPGADGAARPRRAAGGARPPSAVVGAEGRLRCASARSDHLGDPRLPLADCARALVAERPGHRPAGPVRLLTTPRFCGIGFNPVSFYYLQGRDGV